MNTTTILLVDDEPHVLSALRRALATEGYRIEMASGAAQALEVLERCPAQVVLTDNDMSGMGGMELLAQVERRHPDVVRMMLSGRTEVEAALEAVNSGALYRFVAKPWEDEDLKLSLKLALEHRADRLRVRELSRLLAQQAALFARILERHPDCSDLLAGYIAADDAEAA